MATRRCACGSRHVFSIHPGVDAVYAVARDAFGTVDSRLAPILVKAPQADVALCLRCWSETYVGRSKAAEQRDPGDDNGSKQRRRGPRLGHEAPT